MNKLTWYWHRLRAMGPGEIAAHARRRWYQIADARQTDFALGPLVPSGVFPKLPRPEAAPAALRAALAQSAAEILAGRWRAFGRLELRVDDPPRWHKDYLAGTDLATTESAFKLDNRAQPGGADIKLIWEPSRWYSLARLAQAAYVLNHAAAARKCVAWLEDWAAHNPPYRGWNWTSALESGMRLVQFAWMDALLAGPVKREGTTAAWERLRDRLLPPHYRFTWRYRSFGSSANNHLLGELAGLIVAGVRWPALARGGPSLARLQALWEAEVLAQFAADGGNREQALNYHLYSWEFCWQVKIALENAGRPIAAPVLQRLAAAARFFVAVQTDDPWDYGDSDSAFVTPLFVEESGAVREWRAWMQGQPSPGLEYWLGPDNPKSEESAPQEIQGHALPTLHAPRPTPHAPRMGPWRVFPESGICTAAAGGWWLRWDASPLGYLSTASHGHADAQHLSVWFNGVALVIDPGTGAYYAEPELRVWLASRAAHNGPCPAGWTFPKRLGAFLWGEHHPRPTLREPGDPAGLQCELALPQGTLRRTVSRLERENGWRVADELVGGAEAGGGFSVLWQFAPGTRIEKAGERRFRIRRGRVAMEMVVGAEWAEAQVVMEPPATSAAAGLAGTVSAHFRETAWAPYVKLVAKDSKACVLPTTFIASEVQ